MSEYDIAKELARLHTLSGADFIRQLKMLTKLNIFKPIEDEHDIYSTGGEHSEDYDALLVAARKAVFHGNKVFMLPNPTGSKTS